MANQKLNEVTTVPTASINNVKTFLAVMNDGSIQQMSKTDMATVLGELFSSLKLYPFMFRDTVNADNVSWNLESGIYFHGSKLYNEGSFGILIVFIADNYSVQFDINLGTPSIYYRSSHGYGEIVDANWTKLH